MSITQLLLSGGSIQGLGFKGFVLQIEKPKRRASEKNRGITIGFLPSATVGLRAHVEIQVAP